MLSSLLQGAGLLTLVANVMSLNRPVNAVQYLAWLVPGVFEYASFLAIWLSLFLFIFAARASFLPPTYETRKRWVWALVYHSLCTGVASLQFIGNLLTRAYGMPMLSAGVLAATAINTIRVAKTPKGDSTAMARIARRISFSASESALLIDDDEVPSPRKNVRQTNCCTRIAVIVFDIAVFVLFALLLGGTWSLGIGYAVHGPRGVLVNISEDRHRVQNVHVWCTGRHNSSLPTFWLEVGGGGHSMSDLYGLQFALNERGRRVCQYDVLGTGWSDPPMPFQDDMDVMEKVAMIIDEGPYIMVATMDDAPARIYRYALKYPFDVKALVPIDYAGGPEFLPMEIVNNWTRPQTLSYARSTIAGRVRLGNLIRAIAVQWGIIPFFVPLGDDYVPANMEREKLLLNIYNEKQWTRQTMVLQSQVDNIEVIFEEDVWTSNRTLDESIPVFAFAKTENVTQSCADANAPLDSVTCKVINETAAYRTRFAQQMASVTPGGKLFECTDDCKGFLTGAAKLPWLVERLIGAVDTILV
eukprot:Opistho-2@57973